MRRSVFHYSIKEIAPYIDWSYLLHAWGLGAGTRHKSTADELIHDAKAMLHAMEGRYRTHALFALCDARGDGDDLVIEGKNLPLLRQQHSMEGMPCLCLSDFVSPHGDKVGLFATTVDEAFGTEFRNDDYMNILAQALADRLAEATATVIHLAVRKREELWGYSPHEALSIEELNKERYQGIRPAVGYPSLPDQSIIFIIDSLLRVEEIGIKLTANGAMYPHASVCGMMIAHPAARYFAVGKISTEQLDDYASRRGIPREQLNMFLAMNVQEQEP